MSAYYTSSYQVSSLKQETELLLLRMLALQQKAYMSAQTETITFDTALHCYTDDTHTHQLPRHCYFGFPRACLGPPSAPTHPIVDSVSFANQHYAAHADGSVTSGAVYITDGVNTYAICVPIASTGNAYLYCYTHMQWKRL